MVIHQRKREKRASKVEKTSNLIITSTHHHYSERRLKKAHPSNCQDYSRHTVFAHKPNFVHILMKVLILVLHQRKREIFLYKIYITAKVIIDMTHNHLSEVGIEEGTSQELS